MRWFGESWKGDVCAPEQQALIMADIDERSPLATCARCKAGISPGDQGLEFLFYAETAEPHWDMRRYHLGCFLLFLGLEPMTVQLSTDLESPGTIVREFRLGFRQSRFEHEFLKEKLHQACAEAAVAKESAAAEPALPFAGSCNECDYSGDGDISSWCLDPRTPAQRHPERIVTTEDLAADCGIAMEAVDGDEFAASLSQPARAEFEGGTMLGELLAGVPDDLLHPRDVLLKGDRTLESVAGPEFLNHLRERGLVDRVCDRCRLPYLTARPGPVCAGCLTDDERRSQSIATLDEMVASNENVTGR